MEALIKYKSVLRKLVSILLIFALMYISITHLLPFFAPFVLAIIVSCINEPVIRILVKLKITRNLAAVISLLVTISAFAFAITSGIIKLLDELTVLQKNLVTHSSDISAQLDKLFFKITNFYNALPIGITDTIASNLSTLTYRLTGVITSLIQRAINTASSIPAITVFIIITLLATYFISSDKKRISLFLYRQLPISMRKNMTALKQGTFKALLGYFRAMLIMMGLTFVEVSIGLFLLDVKYAFLMALIVGMAEAVPVFGTGLVMLPWISWHLITGDMSMVFGLAIIYILGVLLRQILEPKIVGSQIGLHPLVTLLAMYIGLKFFGVLGMFIGPISIIIVKNIQDAGFIKLWE